MIRTISALILVWSLLCACRDSDVMTINEMQRVFPSHEEIIEKAYDNSYNVPEGFLVDERANITRSYTMYHVKDTSVSYELCSDDHAEAAAWESADNESRSVNGVYVDSYENDRYFEFIRELAYPNGIGNITDPTSPGFSRVFRCSYVNRNGVDRNLRDGYAGTLNVQPLTEDAISTFVEYMWQFTFFWPARKTVLESFSDERTDAYQHTLMLAFITNQGFENCDLVEIVDWIFSVNKENGHVTKEFRLLYSFEAQNVNGIPRLCGN